MSNYRDFAVTLAKQAGQILMDHHGQMQKLEWKLRTNFKTEVDDKVDAFCRREIRKAFPDHRIESEEADVLESASEYTWVIDPLDGTLPYTYGINDHFSVCVGLVKGKQPILGAINAPLLGEFYIAETGKGTTLNGKTIRVNDQTNLSQTFIDIEYGKIDRAKHMPYQAKLLGKDGIAYVYTHGCASVSLAMVASGKLDGYFSLKLEPWDMAATVCVIREAGGKVTDINGKEWELGDESILAANPTLHQKLFKLLHA